MIGSEAILTWELRRCPACGETFHCPSGCPRARRCTPCFAAGNTRSVDQAIDGLVSELLDECAQAAEAPQEAVSERREAGRPMLDAALADRQEQDRRALRAAVAIVVVLVGVGLCLIRGSRG